MYSGEGCRRDWNSLALARMGDAVGIAHLAQLSPWWPLPNCRLRSAFSDVSSSSVELVPDGPGLGSARWACAECLTLDAPHTCAWAHGAMGHGERGNATSRGRRKRRGARGGAGLWPGLGPCGLHYAHLGACRTRACTGWPLSVCLCPLCMYCLASSLSRGNQKRKVTFALCTVYCALWSWCCWLWWVWVCCVLCVSCFIFFFCVYVLAFCSEDGPQYFYPPVEAIRNSYETAHETLGELLVPGTPP
jgi:hypothetical protein